MKKAEKNRQGMWDLLLPILLVIAVMPWIVRLAVYSCGYSEYDWYATDDMLADFYCYYKSYFFAILGILSGIVLLFRLGLYKEKTKNMKIFLPVGVYALFVLLSTVFSMNLPASLQGNFESFESCLVLLSYGIIAVYAYQIMEWERDYKYIWYAVVGISLFFIVIGGFQIFQKDLMNYEWMQRFLMTKEEFEIYGGEIGDTFTGNNVYLTLYNPNYAGIALNMLFAIVFVMFMTEQTKKVKIAYGVLAVGLFILIWYTYSRASLLAVVFTIIFVAVFWLRHTKIKGKSIAIGIAGGVLLLLLLVIIDGSMEFKYLSRMFDKNTREPLESMVTGEDGIQICYDDVEYLLFIEDDLLWCKVGNDTEDLSAKEGIELSLPMEKDAEAIFFENKIYLNIAENTISFIKEEEAYYYETVHGKLTDMEFVEAVDFHGFEYLGSARGYIWSRTLPLLKEYLFIGSGPDTFAEVFPQHDYAGKVVYSDRPDMIIEKAHNDYLTKWVQTGGISLLCIVIFYILFIKKGAKAYLHFDTFRNRMGLGCYIACISYMITSFFNDSTLQTTPFFWVFAGIALSSIMLEKNP